MPSLRTQTKSGLSEPQEPMAPQRKISSLLPEKKGEEKDMQGWENKECPPTSILGAGIWPSGVKALEWWFKAPCPTLMPSPKG